MDTESGIAQDQQTTAGRPVRWGRDLWLVVLLASLAGLAFTTIQTVEKIDILKNPYAALACDVNATLSCSNVLTAWQSSVLGPPNALIGAVMFAILGSAAVSGLSGSVLARGYLAGLCGLAIFFLCFATWFMYEPAYDAARCACGAPASRPRWSSSTRPPCGSRTSRTRSGWADSVAPSPRRFDPGPT